VGQRIGIEDAEDLAQKNYIEMKQKERVQKLKLEWSKRENQIEEQNKVADNLSEQKKKEAEERLVQR
jgi:hypothetical protein